jgi:hypothetical protein
LGGPEEAAWLDQDGPNALWFEGYSSNSPTTPYPLMFGAPMELDRSNPLDAAYADRLDIDTFAHRIHVSSAVGSAASRHAAAQRLLWEALRGSDDVLVDLALRAGADPHETSWTVIDAAPAHGPTPMAWALKNHPTHPSTVQLWHVGGAQDPAPAEFSSGLACCWAEIASKLPTDINDQWAALFHQAGLLGLPGVDGLTPLDIALRGPGRALESLTRVVPPADRGALLNQSTNWLGSLPAYPGHQPARSLRFYGPSWLGLAQWMLSRPPDAWHLDDTTLTDLLSDAQSCAPDLAPWIAADALLPRTPADWIVVDGHDEPLALGVIRWGAYSRSADHVGALNRIFDALGVPSQAWDAPLVYDPRLVDCGHRRRSREPARTMRQEMVLFFRAMIDACQPLHLPLGLRPQESDVAALVRRLLDFGSGPPRAGDAFSSDGVHSSARHRRL